MISHKNSKEFKTTVNVEAICQLDMKIYCYVSLRFKYVF